MVVFDPMLRSVDGGAEGETIILHSLRKTTVHMKEKTNRTVKDLCRWYLWEFFELFSSFFSLLCISPALLLLAEVEGESIRSTLSEGSSCGKMIEFLNSWNVYTDS